VILHNRLDTVLPLHWALAKSCAFTTF